MTTATPGPAAPAGPGPKPGGPTHPTPTHPPSRLADDLRFAAVDAVLDDLKTARPRADRAGGPPAPGADFRLPRDVRPVGA